MPFYTEAWWAVEGHITYYPGTKTRPHQQKLTSRSSQGTRSILCKLKNKICTFIYMYQSANDKRFWLITNALFVISNKFLWRDPFQHDEWKWLRFKCKFVLSVLAISAFYCSQIHDFASLSNAKWHCFLLRLLYDYAGFFFGGGGWGWGGVGAMYLDDTPIHHSVQPLCVGL